LHVEESSLWSGKNLRKAKKGQTTPTKKERKFKKGTTDTHTENKTNAKTLELWSGRAKMQGLNNYQTLVGEIMFKMDGYEAECVTRLFFHVKKTKKI